MRPWLSCPFGRHTRSQASFAKRQACQEDYLQSKRQETFCPTVITLAVQNALSKHSVPKPLWPYTEYQLKYHPNVSTKCLGFNEATLPKMPEELAQLSSTEFEKTQPVMDSNIEVTQPTIVPFEIIARYCGGGFARTPKPERSSIGMASAQTPYIPSLLQNQQIPPHDTTTYLSDTQMYKDAEELDN